MNELLGEYGGVVIRKLKLFQKDRVVGDNLTPEELGQISLRHRMALQNANLVRYYSEPEGLAEGMIQEAPIILTPPTTKKKSASNKRKKSSSKKRKSKKSKKKIK